MRQRGTNLSWMMLGGANFCDSEHKLQEEAWCIENCSLCHGLCRHSRTGTAARMMHAKGNHTGVQDVSRRVVETRGHPSSRRPGSSNVSNSSTDLRLDLLLVGGQRLALCGDALLPPLAGGLGLRALGVHLLLDAPLTGLLGLGLVDLIEMLGQS